MFGERIFSLNKSIHLLSFFARVVFVSDLLRMKAAAVTPTQNASFRAGSNQQTSNPTRAFENNRTEATQLKEMKDMTHNSPRTVAQLQAFAGAFGDSNLSPKPNSTGRPDTLKTGLENLSGMDLSEVKVHYNSSKPAQLQALAYAQGTEIHLGPGQEKHLPHEGWHVVQQKQGRVKPTMQMKGSVNINDDKNLEKEADEMGARAMRAGSPYLLDLKTSSASSPVIQRKVGFEFEDGGFNTWISTFLWGGWFRDRHWITENNNSGVRPAHKKERLHRGVGFNAEADITPPTSDLEFVTEAFEETRAGRRRLITTLVGIKNVYETIGPLAGRDHMEGNFITSSESGFSNNNAMLSRGSAGGQIKMQVTQGIPLEQLPLLMQYMGTGVANETALEITNRTPSRRVMYGAGNENSNAFFAQLLGQSPEMADEAIMRLNGDQTFRTALQNDNGELRGFLALVLNYIRAFGFYTGVARPGDAAKHRTTLMARTDLAAIINLLPQEVISAIETQASIFKNVILRVANNWRGAREPNYTFNTPLLNGVRSINAGHVQIALPELTIGIWLDHLIADQDIANEEMIQNWLSGGNLTEDEISDRGERLRGLGGLEDTTDRRDNRKLPIFENRALNPLAGNQLTFDQATDVAMNYFDFLLALRNGQIGAFPQNQYQYQ